MAAMTSKRPIPHNTAKNSTSNGHGAAHHSMSRTKHAAWQSLSTFLFARPSFLEGLARIFDFGNTLTEYNRSRTPQEADARALASDWLMVGEDIANAESYFSRRLYASSSR